MSSLIQSDRTGGLPAGAKGAVEAGGELVHQVLATPVQGLVNVDHSMKEPGVRHKMVERVKELIAAGYYDKPEFLDLLAQRLSREV